MDPPEENGAEPIDTVYGPQRTALSLRRPAIVWRLHTTCLGLVRWCDLAPEGRRADYRWRPRTCGRRSAAEDLRFADNCTTIVAVATLSFRNSIERPTGPDSPMVPHQSPRRRLTLFIAVLVLPCAVLVALGARMVVQDRELATKHLADRRQLLAANLTRAIVDHLEQLKLDETTALRARSGENDRLARHATVFVTTVDSTGPRLPWSRSSTEVLPHKDFTDRVARGSRAELAGHRSADAADAYRDAQRHAADALQAAYAELLLARSLATVAPSASRSAYLHLLALPLTVRDDDGVPFAFYAARTLDSDSSFRRHVRDFVRRRLPDVAVSRTLSPVACFAFADIDGAEGMRQRCADLELTSSKRVYSCGT